MQGRLFIQNRQDGGVILALEYPPGQMSILMEIGRDFVAGCQVAMMPCRADFGPASVPVKVTEVDAGVVNLKGL